jgi:hypothetical protein
MREGDVAKHRPRSVGQRLMAMSVVTSSVALLLACAAFLAYEVFTFRESMVQSLQTHADILAANVESALLFNDPKAASETIGALRADPHIISIHILRDGGEPFAEYVRAGTPAAAPPLFSSAPDHHRFERDRLILTHTILSDRAPVGVIYIQADLEEMSARLWRYAVIVVGVLLAALVVGSLLAARLQRRISRPILELAAAAKAVSVEKDYAIRVAATDPDELGMLGRASCSSCGSRSAPATSSRRSPSGAASTRSSASRTSACRRPIA